MSYIYKSCIICCLLYLFLQRSIYPIPFYLTQPCTKEEIDLTLSFFFLSHIDKKVYIGT